MLLAAETAGDIDQALKDPPAQSPTHAHGPEGMARSGRRSGSKEAAAAGAVVISRSD